MRVIKGFASIAELADNASDTTSIIGELSPYSVSFSKEKGVYGSAALGDVEFISFSSKLGNGNTTTTPTVIGNEVAEVINWVYEQIKSGNLGLTVPDIVDNLAGAFSQYEDFIAGEIISTNTISAPSWIAYTSTQGSDDYYVKVWFTDVEFRGQYDEWEIAVIPPISLIDGFFNNFATVNALLNAMTITEVVTRTNTASEQKPYTQLKTINVNWINTLTSGSTLPTTWTLVVWGAYGLNITNIKAAIRAYLVEASLHTEAEWRVIMPSLFVSTEFVISPHWDRYSIPNQTTQAGLYNPVFTPQQIIDYALTTRGVYPEIFVQNSVRGTLSTYKSLAFSVVGNPDNNDGITTFNAKFPDYIPVPSTSLDYARMSLKTQEWSTLLHDMLPIAEAMNEVSSLPEGLTRVWRDDIMYLAGSVDEVLYLINAKYYFTNP